ncbi:MAG: rhodanese-like domain-containing protein [Cyanobacteria bacterium P01_D01_bin.128]
MSDTSYFVQVAVQLRVKLSLAIALSLILGACSVPTPEVTSGPKVTSGPEVTSGLEATVSPAALMAQIEANTAPVIVDVRTPEEFEAGHVPGAINIPHRELSDRLDELLLEPGQPAVVYCERGVRAAIATDILNAAGIEQIIHLEGDMAQWRRTNLPIAYPGLGPSSQ